MARTLRYLSHPQVQIDPHKKIETWSLNDVGRSRVASLAQSHALNGTRVVISSGETKAIETASPIAQAIGCRMQIRPDMHENDRSATGFLPPAEFEKVADQFFAKPNESVRGWETATAAQARIVTAVLDCIRLHPDGDILFVGHGGVGTLLYCHLSDVGISRTYDQGLGGGGCFFEFDDVRRTPKSKWRPLEELVAQT